MTDTKTVVIVGGVAGGASQQPTTSAQRVVEIIIWSAAGTSPSPTAGCRCHLSAAIARSRGDLLLQTPGLAWEVPASTSGFRNGDCNQPGTNGLSWSGIWLPGSTMNSTDALVLSPGAARSRSADPGAERGWFFRTSGISTEWSAKCAKRKCRGCWWGSSALKRQKRTSRRRARTADPCGARGPTRPARSESGQCRWNRQLRRHGVKQSKLERSGGGGLKSVPLTLDDGRVIAADLVVLRRVEFTAQTGRLLAADAGLKRWAKPGSRSRRRTSEQKTQRFAGCRRTQSKRSTCLMEMRR